MNAQLTLGNQKVDKVLGRCLLVHHLFRHLGTVQRVEREVGLEEVRGSRGHSTMMRMPE